jgi:hypothetical protein
MGTHVVDFLDEFCAALRTQLEDDELRWGATWLERPREGQGDRSWFGMMNRYHKYKNAGTPINWLQVAGDALICWIREQHPEVSPNWCSGEHARRRIRLIISDHETLTPDAAARVVEEDGQRILETEI